MSAARRLLYWWSTAWPPLRVRTTAMMPLTRFPMRRGTTMVEAALVTALAAIVVAGAGAAQLEMLRADHALLNRMRAALIADSAIELMRAGQPRGIAIMLANRDASRQLLGGSAILSQDQDGINVLTVRWSELAANAPWHEAACQSTIGSPAGYVHRCVSVGFLK